MADSNRVRISYVREDTPGTTPAIADGNLRTARITGESLNFNITTATSNEIRSDRNVTDVIQTGASNQGDLNFELSYPEPDTFISDFIAAALFNDWSADSSAANILAGTSADITATTTGLASTTFDFTAHDLRVGQWLKIANDTHGFATAANNTFVRIAAIAAHALTLDNLPTGWSVDAGTGKTINLLVADTIKNGVELQAFSVEKGFLDLSPNVFGLFSGNSVGQMSLNFAAGAAITGTFTLLGYAATSANASVGDPAAASTAKVLNAVKNVGRIAMNGATITGPNFVRSMTLTVANNLREQTAVGHFGLVGVGVGRADITGQMSTYFGSKDLYDRFLQGTESSVSIRSIGADGRGVLISLPRIAFESGRVVATGPNADVMCDLTYRALLDPTSACQIQIDRFTGVV